MIRHIIYTLVDDSQGRLLTDYRRHHRRHHSVSSVSFSSSVRVSGDVSRGECLQGECPGVRGWECVQGEMSGSHFTNHRLWIPPLIYPNYMALYRSHIVVIIIIIIVITIMQDTTVYVQLMVDFRALHLKLM